MQRHSTSFPPMGGGQDSSYYSQSAGAGTTHKTHTNGYNYSYKAGNGTTGTTSASTSTTTTTLPSSSTTTTTTAAYTSTGAAATTLSPTMNRPRRRRRVKSTAFSRHYGTSGIFFGLESDIRCMMGMALIVGALIGAALMIIFNLLRHRYGAELGISSSFDREAAWQDHLSEFEARRQAGVYTIPNSMSHIGDKSEEYALLRKDFEEQHPHDPDRSLELVASMRKYDLQIVKNPSYDIYNCPDYPPDGYPYEWKTLDVLDHWQPNDPVPPKEIHQGLCVFDYRRDHVKALRYRKFEVPFIVRGDPDVAQAAERWNDPQYMSAMMGDVMHRAEYSESNNFMYWVPANGGKTRHGRGPPSKPPPGWKAPTKMIRMTYKDWLRHANVTDDSLLTPDKPHWYFRLIGCGETGPHGECDAGSSEYLFDELVFFQPRPGLYIVDPEQQKGIHCRFGMTGVIAENHFDASRNAIVVLGGERRYILSRPEQCPNMALYPNGHPSARHSQVDWNDPDLDAYPEFGEATSNEVVLQTGDVLYLPTNWFHFIVSLSLNFQCNTRSGRTDSYMEPIRECGF